MKSKPHELHLISFDLCPYVERSRVVLHEKEVAFEQTMIDLDDKPDWFLEISPRGKVPVLVVDDNPIFESYVINELLEELYPEPSLFPDDPLEKAEGRSWIVFNNDVLMKHAAGLWFADHPEKRQRAEDELRTALKKVEKELRTRDKGPYFLGEDFSLVDAVYAPLFTRWEATKHLGHGDILEGLEQVQNYKTALLDRKSVKKAKAKDLTEKMLEN